MHNRYLTRWICMLVSRVDPCGSILFPSERGEQKHSSSTQRGNSDAQFQSWCQHSQAVPPLRPDHHWPGPAGSLVHGYPPQLRQGHRLSRPGRRRHAGQQPRVPQHRQVGRDRHRSELQCRDFDAGRGHGTPVPDLASSTWLHRHRAGRRPRLIGFGVIGTRPSLLQRRRSFLLSEDGASLLEVRIISP